MKIIAILCFLLVTSAISSDAANILALLTTPSRSHHIWNRVLVNALANRGHHVTIISPDTDENPPANVTQILIVGAYQHDETNYASMTEASALNGVKLVSEWGQNMCQQGMDSEGLRTLLSLETKFDLVLVEVVTLECYWALVDKFGRPPMVAVTAFSSPPWAEAMAGNLVASSYMPSFYLPYTDKMGFLQRVHNTLVTVFADFYRHFVHLPRMDALARRRLGPSTPSIADIERNVSVVLVNTQIGIDNPRPLLPAMVEIGGLHLSPAKPLPQDLKKWMDESKHGVIFFALGSNVRSDKLHPDTISAILKAFGRLRQRVLWKYESPDLPGKPENVRIEKWLPQRDVLGHPKVLLFISHCGLLSTQEATYFGVPVVGIPFFGDQFINMARMAARGVAEGVVFSNLTADGLYDVITKVLDTPSYRTKMQAASKQFRDLPQNPLHTALFWIDYVIRHKGAPHLRSASMSLTWVQLHLIDVIGVAALAIAVFLFTVYLFSTLVIRMVMGKRRKTKSSLKNKKN